MTRRSFDFPSRSASQWAAEATERADLPLGRNQVAVEKWLAVATGFNVGKCSLPSPGSQRAAPKSSLIVWVDTPQGYKSRKDSRRTMVGEFV